MRDKTYKEKTEEIMEAIRDGHKFYVETYIGRLEVKGINPDGDWAYTGKGNSTRSWAICSTEINRWSGELNATKEVKEIFGNPISVYTSEQASEDGFLVEIKDDEHFNHMTSGVWKDCVDAFVIKDDNGKPLKGLGFNNTHKAMMRKLLNRIRQDIVGQIRDKKARRDDWFYKVNASGWTFFVAQNETAKFTLMFPEEY